MSVGSIPSVESRPWPPMEEPQKWIPYGPCCLPQTFAGTLLLSQSKHNHSLQNLGHSSVLSVLPWLHHDSCVVIPKLWKMRFHGQSQRLLVTSLPQLCHNSKHAPW